MIISLIKALFGIKPKVIHMSVEEEEARFNAFIKARDDEYNRKHPNSIMAPGVTKCQVGRTWTEDDYCDLIGAIGEGVTLNDFSVATGRSHYGIVARLRMLRLVYTPPGKGYKDFWRPVLYKRRMKFYTSAGNEVNIISGLIAAGYEDKGKYLLCPDWLKHKELKR